jgi:hypothetical protein
MFELRNVHNGITFIIILNAINIISATYFLLYNKIQEIIKIPNNIKIIHILGLYIVISNIYNMYQTRIQIEKNKSTRINFIV